MFTHQNDLSCLSTKHCISYWKYQYNSTWTNQKSQTPNTTSRPVMKFGSRCKYRYKNKYGNWESSGNIDTTTNMVFDSQMQYSYKNNYGIWQSNENTNTSTNMVFDRAVQVDPGCQRSSQLTNGRPPSPCLSSQVRSQGDSSSCIFRILFKDFLFMCIFSSRRIRDWADMVSFIVLHNSLWPS